MADSIIRPEAPSREEQPFRPRWLMLPMLGAPLLALALHQAEYMLTPWACDRGGQWVQHLVAFVVLLGTLGLGLVARRAVASAPEVESLANSAHARAARRTRFLGQVGIGASAISALLVLAYWIAILVLDPCNRA